jgi:hypothetical protein
MSNGNNSQTETWEPEIEKKEDLGERKTETKEQEEQKRKEEAEAAENKTPVDRTCKSTTEFK